MKYKAYYYENENLIAITEEKDEKPDYSAISACSSSILINLESKNVTNIYEFFKVGVLNGILKESFNSMVIDYSDIDKEEFYSNATFSKLIEMINKFIDDSNNTISQCKKIVEKE